VRWGGEEFLIVAQVADEDEALHCAERLRAEVAAHDFEVGAGTAIRRTCSIGFACLPFALEAPQSLPWQHVLEIADAALFDAKHAGRNRAYGYAAAGPHHRRFHRPLPRRLAGTAACLAAAAAGRVTMPRRRELAKSIRR
jgi:predicted signal transduction protein with EAL and GGDEF domain